MPVCPVCVPAPPDFEPDNRYQDLYREYGERLFRKLVCYFRQTKLPICRTIACELELPTSIKSLREVLA